MLDDVEKQTRKSQNPESVLKQANLCCNRKGFALWPGDQVLAIPGWEKWEQNLSRSQVGRITCSLSTVNHSNSSQSPASVSSCMRKREVHTYTLTWPWAFCTVHLERQDSAAYARSSVIYIACKQEAMRRWWKSSSIPGEEVLNRYSDVMFCKK